MAKKVGGCSGIPLKLFFGLFAPDQEDQGGDGHKHIGAEADKIQNKDIEYGKGGDADHKGDLQRPLVVLEPEHGKGVLKIG